MTERNIDVVVLGAGAAGMLCAAEAGRRGRRVLLLEHNDRAGRKILISGGGRANFTHLHCTAENFLSDNPHFARSALSRFTPADFVALVEKHGIAYHAKTPGQLFCDGSAQQIVTMLERECAAAGVETMLGTRVLSVHRDTGFLLETSAGRVRAQAVVVATGGLSIAKLGATGFGYDLARQFGHRVVEPRPALVPLVLDAAERGRWCDLAGVSTLVDVRMARKEPRGGSARGREPVRFRDKLLFTHRGLSGPAVLQISSYWNAGAEMVIDLVPGQNVTGQLIEHTSGRHVERAAGVLRRVLPARLTERWMQQHPPAGWSNVALERWEAGLHAWTVLPEGTEGFAKAEVTAGGVSTDGLDPKSMQSRTVPGLFFAGEVTDVTGWLGGYNFQWAWASGAAAGRSV